MSFNGVIHTKSSYAPDISVDIVNHSAGLSEYLYTEAYEYLRKEEAKFYNQFFPDKGITEIDQFTAAIRALISSSKEDIKHLSKFCNQNLSKYVPGLPTTIYDAKYKMILEGEIKEVALNLGVSKKDLCIAITPQNLPRVKKTINKVFNRNFDPKSSSTKYLREFITSEDFSQYFKATVTLNRGEVPKILKEEFDITQVSQDKFTKKGREEILKGSSEDAQKLRMDARKALNNMKKFLFTGKNISKELQEAIDLTWNDIFSVMGDDILAKDFFFEGGNYVKALLGQGGEFYNKVILEYIDILTRKEGANRILKRIIGSAVLDGQEPHSDLQIMLDCGANINFQTKNINEQHSIEVNTNALLIQPNFGADIIDPLVNYFSNEDIQKRYNGLLNKIQDILSNRFFEAMNLNISEQLDQLQVNTFYYIGGNKVIPCSKIIADIKQRNDNGRQSHFVISGNQVTSHDDDYFRKNFNEIYYWRYPEGTRGVRPDDMVPTTKNIRDFNRNAAAISISTSFSLNSLFSQDKGSFELFRIEDIFANKKF